MDKVKTGGRLFYRYLFSYLALVLIPVVVIGIFYSVSFSRAFSNEVFLNVDKDLQNIASQIDSELSVFASVVQQLSVSAQVVDTSRQFNPESINLTKQMLFNYNATNPFISNIYLTLPDIGYILTPATSCQLDYFTKSIFSVEGIEPEVLTPFFTGESSASHIFGTLYQLGLPPEKAILFCYPLHIDYLHKLGAVVFQVPHQSISKIVNEKLAVYNAETFVFDNHMELLASIDVNPQLLTQLEGAAPMHREQLLAGLAHQYIVRSYRSPNSGFSYITLIPRLQQSFSQISRLNYRFFLSILAAVLIGGTAVILVLRLHYFPLSRLHRRADQMVNPHSGNLNELADIENLFEELSGRNQSLTAKLEDSAEVVKTARLQKLLADGYTSAFDFNMDCEDLNICLSSDNFCVTVSYLHNAGTDRHATALLLQRHLDAVFSDSHYIYGTETGKLIMLHCLPEDANQSIIVDLFAQLHCRLLTKENLTLTTGVGLPVAGTLQLSRSYLGASTALDYRFIKGKGQVIDYNEIRPASHVGSYPQPLFDKLSNAILASNERSIDQCIDEIIELVERNNYPLFMARGICFNLINLVTNATSAAIGHHTPVPLNLFDLAELETIQDIVCILKDWRSNLESPAIASSAQRLTIETVLDYLNQNCINCNFSIYETASHFGMALPRFSQYFKEHTNQNVLEYTIRLRMDEAARILSETETDIKDVAQMTGYYNTSSFIRRFKQVHGVTPGDYRKLIKKKHKGENKSGT